MIKKERKGSFCGKWLKKGHRKIWFINHVFSKKWSSEIFSGCKSKVNFREKCLPRTHLGSLRPCVYLLLQPAVLHLLCIWDSTFCPSCNSGLGYPVDFIWLTVLQGAVLWYLQQKLTRYNAIQSPIEIDIQDGGVKIWEKFPGTD